MILELLTVTVLLLPNGDLVVDRVDHLAAWMLRFDGGIEAATCPLSGWWCGARHKTALAYSPAPELDWSGSGVIGNVRGQGEVYDLELVVSPPEQIPYALPIRFVRPDANRDGVVNVSDLVAVRVNIGNEGDEIDPPGADVDGNGIVNVTDLMIVRANMGRNR